VKTHGRTIAHGMSIAIQTVMLTQIAAHAYLEPFWGLPAPRFWLT
jgi:hypothetical protein